MAAQQYYVTPETGINVVGVPVANPIALPSGSSIVQSTVPTDPNGNSQNFNSDGSIKQLASGSAFQSLPTPTAVGAVLTGGPMGVEITCPPASSVTYTIAASQPTSAPTLVRTISNPNGSASYLADRITCATGVAVYITATTSTGGAVPFYRGI